MPCQRKGLALLKKRIQLSGHFTMGRILAFALPSIGMQVVDSSYQVADGYFISYFVNETAFEAENMIYPPLMILMTVGLMFGAGASALISKELGEGHREKANRLLSMTIAVLAAAGVALSVAVYFLLPTVARWVGATDTLMPYCLSYARVMMFFIPFQMLSMAFHSLLITAERPALGLATAIANAAANILLDWLFLAVFHWGMEGAALATGLAWLVSAVIPFIFFARNRNTLHFVRPVLDRTALGQTLYNGASEMQDSVSYAVVAVLFNLQLIRYLKEAGVGAYAVSEYVSGFFVGIFYGISMSIVPVVGYHLGQKNVRELQSLRRNGIMLMGIIGAVMTVLGYAGAYPVSRLFVGYNPELTDMAAGALRIISLSFLTGGITIYSSSYFTGLNQGTASLVIATVKGLIGPLAAIYLLPLIIRPASTALWLASPVAEALALCAVLGCFLWWKRKTADGYLPEPPDPEDL